MFYLSVVSFTAVNITVYCLVNMYLYMCISMVFNFNAFLEKNLSHHGFLGQKCKNQLFLKKNVSNVQLLSN